MYIVQKSQLEALVKLGEKMYFQNLGLVVEKVWTF